MTGQAATSCNPANFAKTLIAWQKVHGRHDLPWQNTRDPYKVWLSEIMLQQTQVVTVKAYFDRFLNAYPTILDLATASLDEILGLWSGLGYYSRARNLHLCARKIQTDHDGQFPKDAATLQTLPGIGPSTAAAIASLCFGERVSILDGNVKRVLTRVLGFEADLSKLNNVRELLQLANAVLPTGNDQKLWMDMPHYTQGIMDLGASLCSTRQPQCTLCPVNTMCVAYSQGRPTDFPVKSRKLKRSSESLWMLHVKRADGAVFLAKRPASGVWAGLHCLPCFASHDDLLKHVPVAHRSALKEAAVFKHVLTHKDLHIHPVYMEFAGIPKLTEWLAQRLSQGRWVECNEWPNLGLPAPVRRLLLVD
ncbi:MAG TPA: A/G-specific adenine glycosylase [Burkholderiaceae bacterium]|nr:A/G-specific adenine glycosylase [Burkholderiaceae bacterium]